MTYNNFALPNFALPNFLTLLPTSDPDFAWLNDTAYNATYNIYNPKAGGGGLKEFQIVQFAKDHDAYRLFGGSAPSCGFWWSLAPEDDCYNAKPAVGVEQYRSNYAVCPEWNAGTNIQRVTIPAGQKFIVGVGQSATCQDGTVLEGAPALLQLNGGACKVDIRGGGNDTCGTDWTDVYDSPCVSQCPHPGRGEKHHDHGHRALRATPSESSHSTTSGAFSTPTYPVSGLLMVSFLLVRLFRH